MSAIDVKNLVKKFHGQTVLHGIDLEVQEGSNGTLLLGQYSSPYSGFTFTQISRVAGGHE